jgi:hypothetical protein
VRYDTYRKSVLQKVEKGLTLDLSEYGTVFLVVVDSRSREGFLLWAQSSIQGEYLKEVWDNFFESYQMMEDRSSIRVPLDIRRSLRDLGMDLLRQESSDIKELEFFLKGVTLRVEKAQKLLARIKSGQWYTWEGNGQGGEKKVEYMGKPSEVRPSKST